MNYYWNTENSKCNEFTAGDKTNITAWNGLEFFSSAPGCLEHYSVALSIIMHFCYYLKVNSNVMCYQKPNF